MYTITKPYNECGFSDSRFSSNVCSRSYVYYADSRNAKYNKNFKEYIFQIGSKLKNIVSMQINGMRILQRWSDLSEDQKIFRFKKILPENKITDHYINFNENECNNGDINTFIETFNNKNDILQISVDKNNIISWLIKDKTNLELRILLVDTPLVRLLGIHEFEDAYVLANNDSAKIIKNSKQHTYHKPNIYMGITNFHFSSSLNSSEKDICYQVLPYSKSEEYISINRYGTFMKLQSTKNINELKIRWNYSDGTIVDMSNSAFSFEIVLYYTQFMS